MNRIDKDYMRSLNKVQFKGKIIVIDSAKKLKEMITELNQFDLLGFDTESKPIFEKGKHSRLAIVQIATPKKVFIVQILKTGFPKYFQDFLVNEKPTKLGIGLLDDLRKLKTETNQELSGYLDLSTLALKKGIIQIGIQALVARYLNRYISKKQQRSNWENDILTRQQKIYAATDAWICLKIYPKLITDTTDYHQFNEV